MRNRTFPNGILFFTVVAIASSLSCHPTMAFLPPSSLTHNHSPPPPTRSTHHPSSLFATTNDENERTAPPLRRRPRIRSKFRSLFGLRPPPTTSLPTQHRRSSSGSKRRRLRKSLQTLSLALSLSTATIHYRPRPARADHPIMESANNGFGVNKKGPVSYRPGQTSREDIEDDENGGKLMFTADDFSTSSSGSLAPSERSSGKSTDEEDFDIYNDDYEDINEPADAAEEEPVITSTGLGAELDEEMFEQETNIIELGEMSESATTKDGKAVEGAVMLKTTLKLLSPIIIFCLIRETIRWNWEQRDVDKGLKIIEEAKKEYFENLGNDDDDDDDDDDEEDGDDDDNDDDDDDDDDDDEYEYEDDDDDDDDE